MACEVLSLWLPAEDARWANSMIRIEAHQIQNHLTLRVEGKLCGPNVAALEDCWKAAYLGSPKAEQAIDLSDVTSVDKTGWCLLRRMHRDGVKFSAKGLAVQTILDELMGKE
jgi:ABC-type transporter Mla MlaB component